MSSSALFSASKFAVAHLTLMDDGTDESSALSVLFNIDNVSLCEQHAIGNVKD